MCTHPKSSHTDEIDVKIVVLKEPNANERLLLWVTHQCRLQKIQTADMRVAIGPS
jgi:hypothetical protein